MVGCHTVFSPIAQHACLIVQRGLIAQCGRRAWIDVRKLFYAHYKLFFNKEHRRSFSSGLACMLDALGMKFEVRLGAEARD